jgi:hypothetical protein
MSLFRVEDGDRQLGAFAIFEVQVITRALVPSFAFETRP